MQVLLYFLLFLMELATDHGDEQFLGPYLLKVKLDSSMAKL